MERAWKTTRKKTISSLEVEWSVEPVAIMPDTLKEISDERTAALLQKYKNGKKLI